MQKLRSDVYGRQILNEREQGHWLAYYIGAEGKRRSATDIIIPASVAEAELERYLADLYHEWATEKHPDVRQLN